MKSRSLLAMDRTPYQSDSSSGLKKHSAPFYSWRFDNAKIISIWTCPDSWFDGDRYPPVIVLVRLSKPEVIAMCECCSGREFLGTAAAGRSLPYRRNSDAQMGLRKAAHVSEPQRLVEQEAAVGSIKKKLPSGIKIRC
jgi:hypothetical protein